jgi:hypothetical protein
MVMPFALIDTEYGVPSIVTLTVPFNIGSCGGGVGTDGSPPAGLEQKDRAKSAGTRKSPLKARINADLREEPGKARSALYPSIPVGIGGGGG